MPKFLKCIVLILILSSCTNQVKKDYIVAISAQVERLHKTKSFKQEAIRSHAKQDKFCFVKCPTGAPSSNLEINHDIFILSYNIKTKYADWVAYKVGLNNISGTTRNRAWQADPKIPKDFALIPSDYKDANKVCSYDRGHQAPLADFSNNNNWEKANYLSNITPQQSALNRGPWNYLEAKTRNLLKTFKEIYVLTGPYYASKKMCKLPHARILNRVPNGYWKIITVVDDQNTYTASFVFDQETPRMANYCNYTKPLEVIEELTKLKFNKPMYHNSPYLLEKLGCN